MRTATKASNPLLQRPMLTGLVLALALAALYAPSSRSAMIHTQKAKINVGTFAKGLEHPWGMAFLPDGRMLVTERPGRLRLVGADGALSEPLRGVPEVYASGQGGLLDVALDPDFKANNLIYLSYAEPRDGGAGTAVARGVLSDSGLDHVEVIFRQEPTIDGGLHFGSRLAFATDGKLFVTLGERFQFGPAQDLSNDLGKIVRINKDGSIPEDNPFVGKKDARPEIWSYGHRNPQGAAIHPETGRLWETEFGPKGGDELNIPKAGSNYGWPLVSWGRHYDGTAIPEPPKRPDFADAIYHWNPVISPSGIAFYTSDTIPGWRGNLLVGGLSSQAITRLTLDGERVKAEERIPMSTRIRDVAIGPDGAVYALTDEWNGEILRLAPEAAAP